MQPAEIQLTPGTILRDRYAIKRIISKGGFGNVYLAHDRTEKRDVAIKEAFFNDDETRKQFDFEGQVLIHTANAGIVRGYETFEHGDRFYLVMDYIDGKNLEEMQIDHFKAHRGPMSEMQVLRLMAAISAATQALHDGHILHRDIKPANIKVNRAGQPILLDLGLAKLFKDPTSKTLIAAQAYTPGYAPLEQCEEEGSTTERTDVYALGATTFYALTGRQPWESMRRIREVHSGHPDMPLPSELAPNISPATDSIVRRALSLIPEERYATARELQGALLAALVLSEATCPRCKTVNEAGAVVCIKCGKKLESTVPIAAAMSQLKAVAAEALTPVPAHAIPQLPSRPEVVQPRRLVRPRASGLAGFALIAGALSICPALGGFAWLLVLPLGTVALNNINRSQGGLKGGGRALLGMGLSLVGLAEVVIALILAVRTGVGFGR